MENKEKLKVVMVGGGISGLFNKTQYKGHILHYFLIV